MMCAARRQCAALRITTRSMRRLLTTGRTMSLAILRRASHLPMTVRTNKSAKVSVGCSLESRLKILFLSLRQVDVRAAGR
jgi:hypothetical protein